MIIRTWQDSLGLRHAVAYSDQGVILAEVPGVTPLKAQKYGFNTEAEAVAAATEEASESVEILSQM